MAGLSISLAGCTVVQSDAPTGLLDIDNSVGVSIHSIKPYKITSYTRILPTKKGHSISSRELQVLQVLDSSCQKNWCLVVSAVSNVADAWKNWINDNSRHCSGIHNLVCIQSPWRRALSDLYAASRRLLGHKPLPFHAHIILLPTGTGYRAAITMNSKDYVPLKFAFWFPTNIKEAGFPEQADSSIIHAVATLGYEFQHVEYAAGQTRGPADPPGAKAIKNEANSECWKLVTKVYLTSHGEEGFSFIRWTKLEMRVNRVLTGGKSNFSSAAVLGPALLRKI